MNYATIIKVTNELKDALRKKRRTIIYDYTKNNISILNFFITNGFINSYKTIILGKKKQILISLRFLRFSQTALSHSSIVSKKAHTRGKINVKTKNLESNFLVKLTKNKNKVTEVYSRFR